MKLGDNEAIDALMNYQAKDRMERMAVKMLLASAVANLTEMEKLNDEEFIKLVDTMLIIKSKLGIKS